MKLTYTIKHEKAVKQVKLCRTKSCLLCIKPNYISGHRE